MEINNLKIQLVEYLNLRRKVVDQPNDLQYTDIYTCKHGIMSDLYINTVKQKVVRLRKKQCVSETFSTQAAGVQVVVRLSDLRWSYFTPK